MLTSIISGNVKAKYMQSRGPLPNIPPGWPIGFCTTGSNPALAIKNTNIFNNPANAIYFTQLCGFLQYAAIKYIKTIPKNKETIEDNAGFAKSFIAKLKRQRANKIPAGFKSTSLTCFVNNAAVNNVTALKLNIIKSYWSNGMPTV